MVGAGHYRGALSRVVEAMIMREVPEQLPAAEPARLAVPLGTSPV